MSLLDALIIYLSCGSPFAMYRIALKDVRFGSPALSAGVSLVLWPLVAVRWTVLSALGIGRGTVSQTADLRAEIEAYLPADEIIKFREVFDLYVDLTTLLRSQPTPASAAVFQFDANSRSPAGLKALTRSNCSKAALRRDLAREFLISVAEYHPDLIACMQRLATAAADEVLSSKLGVESSPLTRRPVHSIS